MTRDLDAPIIRAIWGKNKGTAYLRRQKAVRLKIIYSLRLVVGENKTSTVNRGRSFGKSIYETVLYVVVMLLQAGRLILGTTYQNCSDFRAG